jgi:poly(3-hydroxybutyrate) depolymerase
MKKLYSILSILLFASTAFAQLDTTGGRYCTENFFSSVTTTSNITYGSATTVNNTTQTLLMDIYQPTGDVAATRGLIVFAHGGSFIGGSKTDQDVTALATRFAKMGYVTASIEYRVGMGFPIDSISATKAVIRATQDMKAAVRFFRKDAATTNTYKIDPSFIFVGGSSAGAFMALHLAYLDRLSEGQVWQQNVVTSVGGIDGNSGNPGYSSLTNGVINLCGALGDSTWLEAGNIPVVSMHGTNDATVPYGTAMIYVLGFPIMVVDGSASIKLRADNVGVNNPFHTWSGAPHVPYAGTTVSAMAYMDSTVEFVRAFLCPIVSSPSIFTDVKETFARLGFSVYPNPSAGQFTVRFAEAVNGRTITITDLSGRLVASTQPNGTEYSYSGSKLNAGIYFVKVAAANREEAVQKIIITD